MASKKLVEQQPEPLNIHILGLQQPHKLPKAIYAHGKVVLSLGIDLKTLDVLILRSLRGWVTDFQKRKSIHMTRVRSPPDHAEGSFFTNIPKRTMTFSIPKPFPQIQSTT
jgi:hypothetical protein